MITRDELREIPELHKRIARKEEQLLFLREKATAIPSILPDPNKVQTSPTNNVNKYSDEAVDLAKEIEGIKMQLEQLKVKAQAFIITLPCVTETEKLTIKIMRLRYLKCYSWDDVAELTGYADRYIRRLEHDIVKDL